MAIDYNGIGGQTESKLLLSCNLAPYIHDISKDPLAVGGFSSIFQARLSNKCVAIKKVRTYGLEPRHIEQIITQEYAVWHQLNHPNILPLVGICYLEGDKYASFVSPWQENGRILDFLQNNPDSDLLRMLQQIGEAISYLHQNNLVHGDIRAANILFSSTKQPLLTDFGISKKLRSETGIPMSSAMRGNVRWMAHEFFKQENGNFRGYDAYRSPASDCWSFGMTMMEIFTGKRPYDDDHYDASVIYKIGSGVLPKVWEALHPQWRIYRKSLRDVCLLCWDLDPNKRAPIKMLVAEIREVRRDASIASRILRTEPMKTEEPSTEPQHSTRRSTDKTIRVSSLLRQLDILAQTPKNAPAASYGDIPLTQSPVSVSTMQTIGTESRDKESSAVSTPVRPKSPVEPVDAANPHVCPGRSDNGLTPADPKVQDGLLASCPASSVATPGIRTASSVQPPAFKTELYNYVARIGKSNGLSITYSSEGLSHIPTWHATITFDGSQVGKSSGRSKGEAANEASKEALRKIHSVYAPPGPHTVSSLEVLTSAGRNGGFFRTGLDHHPSWSYIIDGGPGVVQGGRRTKVEARLDAVVNQIEKCSV